MTDLPVLFVTGASGKLGRLVVEQLLARGYAGRIVAGTRNPGAVAFPGVEVRRADFADPDGLAAAFAGVDRVLIISTDVIGDIRRTLQGNAVAAAKAAGVKRIVYTSMPYPEPGNVIPMAADHYQTEQAIKASGIEYTILRVNWYTENLLGLLPPVLRSGRWFTAGGEGRISYIARLDVARAAAGALLSDDVGSRVMTLTGTEAYSTREIAAIATEITGTPIEVVDVPDADLTAGMMAAGLPDGVARLLTTFDIGQREGVLSMVTNAFEILWGTRPQGVGDFLRANRAALG